MARKSAHFYDSIFVEVNHTNPAHMHTTPSLIPNTIIENDTSVTGNQTGE